MGFEIIVVLPHDCAIFRKIISHSLNLNLDVDLDIEVDSVSNTDNLTPFLFHHFDLYEHCWGGQSAFSTVSSEISSPSASLGLRKQANRDSRQPLLSTNNSSLNPTTGVGDDGTSADHCVGVGNLPSGQPCGVSGLIRCVDRYR